MQISPGVLTHTYTHMYGIWLGGTISCPDSKQYYLMTVLRLTHTSSTLFWGKTLPCVMQCSLRCIIALYAENCISYKAYINICYTKHMKTKWEKYMLFKTSSWLKISITIHCFRDDDVFSMYNCQPVFWGIPREPRMVIYDNRFSFNQISCPLFHAYQGNQSNSTL